MNTAKAMSGRERKAYGRVVERLEATMKGKKCGYSGLLAKEGTK